MKMISRQHNKRARKSTLQKILLAVVFILLILGLNRLEGSPLAGVTHVISIPFLKVQEFVQTETRNYANLVRSKRSLVDENNTLKRVLLENEKLSLQYEALQQENEELKFLLGRDIEGELILGNVVTKEQASPYDTFLIDIGAVHDVHVGDDVIALGDFGVGFVSKVFTRSSQVTLFSAPGEKTNIFIGEQNIPAVATGRGGGNFVTELPRDTEVAEGDIVMLSGLDTQVFAVVERIIAEEADAFQTILFKNPVNIFNLKRVQVVKTEETP